MQWVDFCISAIQQNLSKDVQQEVGNGTYSRTLTPAYATLLEESIVLLIPRSVDILCNKTGTKDSRIFIPSALRKTDVKGQDGMQAILFADMMVMSMLKRQCKCLAISHANE